jgi:hypothetical protein
MKKTSIRKVLVGLTVVLSICTVSILATGCTEKTPTMKGSTYVNDKAEHKPLVFMTETVGVLKFVDDNKVEILFPYAIDTDNIAISSEIWASGEYERSGNTVSIRFKLNKSQEKPGVLEIEVKDDGKTLLGKNGGYFNKVDKN